MRTLLTIISLFFSQLSFSAIITQVPSDWATFRIDLVADQNYTVFGGGSAGDVFHAYFDFNKAYLPYITQVNSEYQSMDFAPHMGGYAPDNTTADPDDFLDFDALPVVGSFMRYEINGISINSVSPFLLSIVNGQIDNLGSSLYGAVNGFLRADNSFYFTDHTYQMDGVFGRVAGIFDTSAEPVNVPEPNILLLLLLSLVMFGLSRVIARKRGY